MLVDTSRIDESFAAINYFENDSELPFVVAVNQFEGKPVHDLDEVRDALALDPNVPLDHLRRAGPRVDHRRPDRAGQPHAVARRAVRPA